MHCEYAIDKHGMTPFSMLAYKNEHKYVVQTNIVLDSTNKPTTFKFHWFFGEV